MITENQIEEIKNIIVDVVQPQKVYLFGSYAKGNATETSDIDLLIIMADRSKKNIR